MPSNYAPFIYQTARVEKTDVNPSGQLISQAAPVDQEDFAYGYIMGDDTIAASSSGNKFQITQIEPIVNGVNTTYSWTKTDTDTTLTLTNNTTFEVSVEANATPGTSVLQCVATNAQASNSPHTVTYDITVS